MKMMIVSCPLLHKNDSRKLKIPSRGGYRKHHPKFALELFADIPDCFMSVAA